MEEEEEEERRRRGAVEEEEEAGTIVGRSQAAPVVSCSNPRLTHAQQPGSSCPRSELSNRGPLSNSRSTPPFQPWKVVRNRANADSILGGVCAKPM